MFFLTVVDNDFYRRGIKFGDESFTRTNFEFFYI
jgi:hypothetical protein